MRHCVTGYRGSLQRSFFVAGLLLFGVAALNAGGAQENASSTTPAFEVVSIRLYAAPKSVPGIAVGRSTQCRYSPDRVQCSMTLQEFIQDAFELKKMQVAGPASLSGPIFVLNATMPAGTAKDTARMMLQRVLADRFQLKFHYESRNIPVYAIVPGKKGVKLQPAAADPAARDKEKIAVPQAHGFRASTLFAPDHLYSTGMSLDLLAANLGFNADLPVVNATGLTGDYKIDVSWSSSEEGEFRSHRFSDPEFLAALQEQAGLRLEKRTMPVKVLVVDHIDSVPSEN
jgi:uncharacterized protein (TIGR03435 family)